MKKKVCWGLGTVLIALALLLTFISFSHPELSIPYLSPKLFWGIYVGLIILLFLFPLLNFNLLSLLSAILMLTAVYFLVESVRFIPSGGKTNWYLPAALGCNCVSLLLFRFNKKN